jgi:hypothetical protein
LFYIKTSAFLFFAYKKNKNKMYFFKYHSTYKLNNKNIIKLFLLLIIFMLFLTSCLYGFVEIHYEKLLNINNDNNNNNVDININNNNDNNPVNDMYKMFEQPVLHAVKSEIIPAFVKNEINNLFDLVDKTKLSIIKPMSFDDVNKIQEFKDNQLILRRKIEEQINNTKNEDDDDDEDDKKEKIIEKVRLYISYNVTDVDSLLFVDRALMVKYLKLEKHRIKRKLNSIKTVKDSLDQKHKLK